MLLTLLFKMYVGPMYSTNKDSLIYCCKASPDDFNFLTPSSLENLQDSFSIGLPE